jgi:hypothetical protein
MLFRALTHAAKLTLTATAGPHTLTMIPADSAMPRSRVGLEAHPLPAVLPPPPCSRPDRLS